MILRIATYGSQILRNECEDIEKDYPNLNELIQNMYETMYNADGVGLAAPQVNLPINIFVIDSSEIKDNDKPIKKVFINPIIEETYGEIKTYYEGCLSLPNISEEVKRPEKIRINYFDENFEEKEESFDGINARIIQHEYDHIMGITFDQRMSPLKKKFMKNKLKNIAKGNFKVDYPVNLPKKLNK